jgi:hypothetical protein
LWPGEPFCLTVIKRSRRATANAFPFGQRRRVHPEPHPLGDARAERVVTRGEALLAGRRRRERIMDLCAQDAGLIGSGWLSW